MFENWCAAVTRVVAAMLVACAVGAAVPAWAEVSPEEARAIAKEAYVYGFPVVDNYRILYSWFADPSAPDFKAPWNTIRNESHVFTPDDKTVQTPNIDTLYSQLGVDLRTEPLVISVPAVEVGRYYSLQFIDLYTFNYAYAGSRTTGNEAGSFLVAGPDWKGETPPGIRKVIRSETQLGLVLFRTQLFRPDDIENVKTIQAGYKVQPLSSFLGTAPPPSAPAIEFVKPLSPEKQRTSVEFFHVLDFALRFCPVQASEKDMRERFAKIGVDGKGSFRPSDFKVDTGNAVQAGIADAWKAFLEFKKTELDTGRHTSGENFGTRKFLEGRYIDRMAGAVLGIYGNSKEEAIYPVYFSDSDGQPLAGSESYRLTFPANQLPPVHAFWSISMYELPSSLLVANSIKRYVINSAMLPELKRDSDGGLTIHIQNAEPGWGKGANWLPAPKGAFAVVLRMYWPKPEAVGGEWKAPPLQHEK